MVKPGQAADNTIGGRLGSRENNFDALRLLAAFTVIVSHAFPIRDGNREREPYFRLSNYCSLGEISVAIFFVISGLLVARSYLSDPNAGSFLKKRVLRIVPGLVACVAFCVLVVGPIFTTLPLKAYFHDGDLLRFARNALLIPSRYDLPGVWEQFSLADPRAAVNGSLWSLPLEFAMYIGVLFLGMAKLLKRKWCLILVASVLLFQWLVVERLVQQPSYTQGTFLFKYRVWFEQPPHLGFLFFCGTLVLLFKDSIVLDWRLFVACLLIIMAGWQTSHGYFLFSLCLPYVVMYLAFVRVRFLKPVLQSATHWGDFSYGVYLYGYPVEQMLFRTWGDKLSFPAFIALSCAGTLLLAALSWHLVEKPFLKLKKRSTRPGPAGSGPNDAVVPVAGVAELDRPIRPPVSMQRQYSVMRQMTFFV